MKNFYLVLTAFILLIVLGAALPLFVSGCTCGYPATPCQGCGKLIGDSLGNFSWGVIGMGLMGFVLLFWFGPFLILFLIAWKIYQRINGSDPAPADQENSIADVLRNLDKHKEEQQDK